MLGRSVTERRANRHGFKLSERKYEDPVPIRQYWHFPCCVLDMNERSGGLGVPQIVVSVSEQASIYAPTMPESRAAVHERLEDGSRPICCRPGAFRSVQPSLHSGSTSLKSRSGSQATSTSDR